MQWSLWKTGRKTILQKTMISLVTILMKAFHSTGSPATLIKIILRQPINYPQVNILFLVFAFISFSETELSSSADYFLTWTLDECFPRTFSQLNTATRSSVHIPTDQGEFKLKLSSPLFPVELDALINKLSGTEDDRAAENDVITLHSDESLQAYLSSPVHAAQTISYCGPVTLPLVLPSPPRLPGDPVQPPLDLSLTLSSSSPTVSAPTLSTAGSNGSSKQKPQVAVARRTNGLKRTKEEDPRDFEFSASKILATNVNAVSGGLLINSRSELSPNFRTQWAGVTL